MPDASMGISAAGIPLAFLWIAFIVELSPGPNMAYLAALTLAEGRRAGFATVLGIALGLLLIGMLAALGIAAIVSESALLYGILRWAGVLYMLWLAYDIWQSKDASEIDPAETSSPLRTYMGRGFLTNVLNPKAAVFFIAILPQFIDPQHDAFRQTIRLSVAYAAVATFVHIAIVLLATYARPFFQNAARMDAIRRVLGFGLVLVAIWLLWSTAENVPA